MTDKMDKNICDEIDLNEIKELQPFVVLLIANKKTLKIKAVSANILSALMVDEKQAIDKELSYYFDDETLSFIESVIAKGKPHLNLKKSRFYSNQFHNFDVALVAYLSGEFIFFEIELVSQESSAHYLSDMRVVDMELNDCESLKDLYELYLNAIYQATAAESIMIYQYADDYSGKVVAQKRKSSMPDFLDHFFPASDTPVPVRKAFLKRLVRYIPDVNYTPLKLVSKLDAKKFNLTHVVSRGVDPIHVEFLKNMGSAGVMSIAIICDEKLWGLVSMHFEKISYIDAQKRNFLTLLTNLLSNKITYRNKHNESEKRDELLTTISDLSSNADKAMNVDKLTAYWIKELTSLISCDGYVYGYKDHYIQSSTALSRKNANLIYKHYVKKGADRAHNIKFSAIDSILSGKKNIKIKSMLLMIISYEEDMYFLLYRFGKTSKKKWAGDPNKHLIVSKTSNKYHPRKSFETWLSTHKDEAEGWSSFDIMAAEQVQRLLIEKILRQQLAQRALRDPLTNLYNRFYLEDNYEREYKIAAREKSALSLCMIDIDFFKKVNDSYGHDAGDDVLKKIAECLLGNFRFEDTVCRYGGEEFVVIMRHPDGDFAKDRCEKFRKLIAQNRYQVSDSKKIKLTISAGVMTIRPSKKKVSLESLVKKADELLYKAKKSGRNKVIAES